MIDFPTTPVQGDTYTFNGRTWLWNGAGWERQVNAGQIVSVFVGTNTLVISEANILEAPALDNWQEITYV